MQQAVLKSGDSERCESLEVLPDDLLTYNVNYLINNSSDNVIRKRLAQFLGKTLENNSNAFQAYLKIFKEFEPKVIGRAFLTTMVLLHHEHWTIHRPGGFFTTQCRALSGQADLKGYTLDDVEGWLRTWGNFPYSELLVALAAPPPRQQPVVPATLLTTPRQVLPAPQGLLGHGGANNRKKRTYGMYYTGLPSGRKEFNTLGPARPPQQEGKS
jgi:hypothetical protein